jgi:hypothetical protein
MVLFRVAQLAGIAGSMIEKLAISFCPGGFDQIEMFFFFKLQFE